MCVVSVCDCVCVCVCLSVLCVSFPSRDSAPSEEQYQSPPVTSVQCKLVNTHIHTHTYPHMIQQLQGRGTTTAEDSRRKERRGGEGGGGGERERKREKIRTGTVQVCMSGCEYERVCVYVRGWVEEGGCVWNAV